MSLTQEPDRHPGIRPPTLALPGPGELPGPGRRSFRIGDKSQMSLLDDGLAELPDEQLVELALGGRTSAFGTLYDRHYGAVFRYLLRLTRGGVPDAEDLAQIVFVNAFEKLGQLKQRAALRGWLRIMALHEFYDWVGAGAARQLVEEALEDEAPTAEERRVELDETSEREAGKKTLLGRFIDWLRRESSKNRDKRRIFFWIAVAGQKQKDVAALLGKERAAVAQIYCRLRVGFLESLQQSNLERENRT
ncbi:MAG: sigma-70 family RNA polymerase sigma factor [Candidatus Riflebacteria bacterium]|nr:sigma-70 family RNA polymerase sigma factor [Candidatus Riflebacteria bacterium]